MPGSLKLGFDQGFQASRKIIDILKKLGENKVIIPTPLSCGNFNEVITNEILFYVISSKTILIPLNIRE